MLYFGLLFAFSLAVSLDGQQLPACLQNVDHLIDVCAQRNNINLKEVISLMTNGTQEPFPPGKNYDSLRASLCGSLDAFKKCNRDNYAQATSSCTQQEKGLAEMMTNSVVNGFTSACDGVTVDTRQDPCIQNLNKNMQACYTKVGVDHTYFQMNSTHKKGAIIGETQEEADKFCMVRKDIFGCIGNLVKDCPKAETVLALSGFDHIALEKGVEVLCQNDKIYLQGLDCFQNPPPGVTNCIKMMSEKIQREAQNELRTGFNKTTYYQNYCAAVAGHVMCDINEWKAFVTNNPGVSQQCDQKVLVMKAHFECELIPTPCTTEITPQVVTNVCNKAQEIITHHVNSGNTSSGKHKETGSDTSQSSGNTNTGNDYNTTPVDNSNNQGLGGGSGTSGLAASSLIILLPIVVSLL